MANENRCVILTPILSSIEPACETALQELERRGYVIWRVRGCSAIDQARNQMATDALLQGYDETMWIDADVAFHPDDVQQLRELSLPISCGIYPKKGQRALAIHAMPGTTEFMFGAEGGLTEILYAANGFLHVRREVYETMRDKLKLPICNERFNQPMIPFFHPLIKHDAHGAWYLAEDFSFCERARQCGFRVMADTRIRLYHFGVYPFSWEDAGVDRQRCASFIFKLNGE